MKLSIRCKSCKKDIMIKDKVQNRFDLQQIYGDELSLRCNNCGTINKKHINRIWAEVS